MNKALAIGAVAATTLLLTACQQPKPAAVETPVTPTPAVTETKPATKLEITGSATIGAAEETKAADTIKVTGEAQIGTGAGANTQLVISPKAEITAPAADTIKVTGEADIAPVKP